MFPLKEKTSILLLALTLAGPTSVLANGDSKKTECDSECRRLKQNSIGLHIGEGRARGGVRFTEGGKDGIGGYAGVSAELLSTTNWEFDADVLKLDIAYESNTQGEHGVRIRWAIAEANVVFFCKVKDEELEEGEGGYKRPRITTAGDYKREWDAEYDENEITDYLPMPGSGMLYDCEQDEMLGLGATLLDFQVDTSTNRWVMRPLEANFVLNFAQNGHDPSFAEDWHLLGSVGLGIDVYGAGDTPGAPQQDWDFGVRLPLRLKGFWALSDNHHWVLRTTAEVSPGIGLAGWDVSAGAWSELLYQMTLDESNDLVAAFGGHAGYQYNHIPAHSLGVFASDRYQHNGWLGLTFQMYYHDLDITKKARSILMTR